MIELDPQKMTFVVETDNLSWDESGEQQLPGIIGPFPSKAAAFQFMESLGPLWGSWNAAPLWSSADVKAWATQDLRKIPIDALSQFPPGDPFDPIPGPASRTLFYTRLLEGEISMQVETPFSDLLNRWLYRPLTEDEIARGVATNEQGALILADDEHPATGYISCEVCNGIDVRDHEKNQGHPYLVTKIKHTMTPEELIARDAAEAAAKKREIRNKILKERDEHKRYAHGAVGATMPRPFCLQCAEYTRLLEETS